MQNYFVANDVQFNYYNRMRRLTIFLLVTAGVVTSVFGQVDRLETYRSNFASANMDTKLEILRSADSEDPEEFGPLYGQALSLVVSNSDSLDSNRVLREIALKSIERIDAGSYRPAVSDLWRLFSTYRDTTTRIQILNVLGMLADESPEEKDNIAEWVARQNNLNQTTVQVDMQVLTAAVRALGQLGDPVAFESILDVILLQYPQFVTSEARNSLGRIEGDPRELAAETLRKKPVVDKGPAFSFFMGDDYIPEDEKAPLALTTMDIALNVRPQNSQEQEAVRQLRFAAAAILRENSYSQATTAVIRHFNETVLEFDRGQTTQDRLLEAIAALGSMGSEEAAIRLTDYLELLNTYTEQDRPFETQIVLAVIGNLEILDYPGSYNALFMTTILENYPDRVRDAAREASMEVAQ
jgi:HEAT repeat protein